MALSRDPAATAAANLNVLRRMDPEVEEVLGRAGHVCLYNFDTSTQQWSKRDMEGSLFVVRRSTQPRFQFIILNRLSTENLVQDLPANFEFELSPPYLLYRVGNQVHGLWFYEDAEGVRMNDLLQRVVKTGDAPPAAPVAAPAALPPPRAQVTILQRPQSQEDITAAQRPAAPAAAPKTQQTTGARLSPATPPAPALTAVAPSAPPASGKAALLTPDFFAKKPTAPPAATFAQPAQSAAAAVVPMAAAAQTRGASNGSPMAGSAGSGAVAASPTPAPAPGVGLTRSDVRDALLRLIMTDTFIDMLHNELTARRS